MSVLSQFLSSAVSQRLTFLSAGQYQPPIFLAILKIPHRLNPNQRLLVKLLAFSWRFMVIQ
jgi:hypothetical protein